MAHFGEHAISTDGDKAIVRIESVCGNVISCMVGPFDVDRVDGDLGFFEQGQHLFFIHRVANACCENVNNAWGGESKGQACSVTFAAFRIETKTRRRHGRWLSLDK